MGLFRSALAHWFRPTPSPKSRRRRSFEVLEQRRVLAANTLASITGVAFSDLRDDGLTADDAMVAGATINLHRDSGDGVFGPGDTLIKSATTDTNGRYRFDDLGAGSYFVEQAAVAGLLSRAGANLQLVTISTAAAHGQNGTPIDSFSTTQSAAASSVTSTTATSSASASEGIGGERDLYSQLTSSVGLISLSVNPFGQHVLQFDSSARSAGRRVISWDGADGNAATLNATGLGGIDLTQNGANVGLMLDMGADAAAQATLRVYSDANNWSEAKFSIPANGGVSGAKVLTLYSDFTSRVGTGAKFTNVGAVELEIEAGAAVDGQIDIISTIGPTVFTANFVNFEPLSVGNHVWNDADNDGALDPGEQPIGNVQVSLHADTDSSGGYTNGDALLSSTTTDSNGNYSFNNLFPGQYVVRVVPANFAAGGALHKFSTSTGNHPTPGPNNDVNSDDNGDSLPDGSVASQTVTLFSRSEPTDDGDSNYNSNLTVDFGFVKLVPDVSITKTDNLTKIVPGQQMTYEIVVSSVGNTTADNVVVTDDLPIGLVTLNSTSDQSNVTFNATTGKLTWQAGNLAVGTSKTLLVTVTSVGPAPAGVTTIVNTVRADHDDTDPTPENNKDDDVDTLDAAPDYKITKDDGRIEVAPGDNLTYTVVASNIGNQDGTGVVVTDTYPTNILDNVTGGPGSIVDTTAGTIVWNVGNLDAGDSVQLSVDARVRPTVDPAITEFTNVVRVADDGKNGPDPTPQNNVDDDTDKLKMLTSKVSGYVYVDFDDDGVKDAGERPIEGVSVRLTGKDARGAAVDRIVQTNADGFYMFDDVAPGMYDLIETQPPRFRDGKDTHGTLQTNAGVPLPTPASLRVLDDQFAQLAIAGGVAGQQFNFGEQMILLSKRDFVS